MRVFLISLVAACLQADGSPPPGEARHIEKVLDWLEDRDEALREIARKELLGLGTGARPQIEARLRRKRAFHLAELLGKINVAVSPYVSKADVEADANDGSSAKDLDPRVVDAYVRARYTQALDLAKNRDFEGGLRMAKALLALEPSWSQSEKVNRLRRYCDRMILQTTLLEAKVKPDALICVEGKPMGLSLRLKNLYRGPLTLRFDKGAPGMAVLPIKVTLSDMYGSSFSYTMHQELKFAGVIPIAAGAEWVTKHDLETSLNLSDEKEMRIMRVNAWMQPLEIEIEGRPMTRRIEFEPAVIKIVPRRYAAFVADPLASLQKAIKGGLTQDVFICAQLLEGEKKRRGTGLLIEWMQKANPEGRRAAALILTVITGKKLGEDPRKWSVWWQAREELPE